MLTTFTLPVHDFSNLSQFMTVFSEHVKRFVFVLILCLKAITY